MEFQTVTGYGESSTSLKNNEDPARTGQGILQGSSSAAPIYNFNSDVSITAYNKLATGASFTHPVTGQTLEDSVIQYVDDKTEMVNEQSVSSILPNENHQSRNNKLLATADCNTDIWAQVILSVACPCTVFQVSLPNTTGTSISATINSLTY